jgi:hypothetical protein
MLKNSRRGLESKHAFSISTNGPGRYGEKKAMSVWLGQRCEEANSVRIFSEPTHCPAPQGVEKNILRRGKHVFLQLANKKIFLQATVGQNTRFLKFYQPQCGQEEG